MSSTEFNVGLTGSKNSSRVLKPPGGGHSDIFGCADQTVPGPRPKYDQQNSSNLNFCMNTTDPNVLVEKAAANKPPSAAAVVQNGGGDVSAAQPAKPQSAVNGGASADSIGGSHQQAPTAQPKGRVPPGGFSSGLW